MTSKKVRHVLGLSGGKDSAALAICGIKFLKWNIFLLTPVRN